MILPKFFSIAITLFLLLFFVTLIDSTKFECLTTFSSLTNSKYEANKERYLILLDQTTVTTTAINSSEKLTSIEYHLGFLESCWGIGSESVLYEGVSTAKLISQNNVLHFSAGEISGYSGLFNDLFINEQIKPLPNVRIIEKVVKGKGGAVQNQPSHNLDRIDQRNFPLDGKYKYPNQAGRGVDVFVLDSGIDVKNAEFEHRATFGAVFCLGCPAHDDRGHGTAVASIVGGKTFGVAKKVRLVAVKVLNSQGEVLSDELVFGMAYVLNEHLKKKSRNTVVNISLQFNFISDAINSFIKKLTDAGIHVIVAAGNFATDACKISPASAPSAITVGATEFFNDSITDFSDFGSCVDIFAPGRNVSLLWGGDPSYPIYDYFGTSFASPAVAGAVALRISVTGNTSPSKMTRIIFNESTKNVVTNLPPNTPNRFLFVPSH